MSRTMVLLAIVILTWAGVAAAQQDTLQVGYNHYAPNGSWDPYEFEPNPTQVFVLSEEESEKALDGFLYCLEQMGVVSVKESFTGDHNECFERVERGMRERRQRSAIFGAMSKEE